MKRRDLERHLRSHGCREIGGSKHTKWRGPQGHVSALPRHEEIGPGLTRSICQQLGITARQTRAEMNSNQSFRWLNSIPALVALALGGIYALGAASVIGQLQSAHLNAFQIMPLVPIDQILARGIGGITSVAVLAFPVGLITALGIFQFEGFSSSKKKETPESSPDSKGVQFPSSWLALFILIAGFMFIPGDYLAILLFSLITMFVIIDVVRKAMNRQGRENWRPAAFLGGYFGFVLVATLIGSIVRPDPLPHAILDLRRGPSVRGSLVVSTGANWYIAQDDNRIIAVPTSNVERSHITYLDPKGSRSLFNKISE